MGGDEQLAALNNFHKPFISPEIVNRRCRTYCEMWMKISLSVGVLNKTKQKLVQKKTSNLVPS